VTDSEGAALEIVTGTASILLALEFVLHGAAMLIRIEAGIGPVEKHLGFRPTTRFLIALGIVDLATSTAFIVGLRKPIVGAVAGGYSTGLFGILIALRLRRRLGTFLSPPDFPIFLALSLIVVAGFLRRVNT
jgi:hypothetical protein